MPLSPSWQDIALRLLLALIASGMIGLNRQARGHAAGLRTTILIGLAAAVAMVLANFLLSTAGKTAELFTTMDVMRLPLGILTGVGFIGGGYDWLGVAATVLTLVTLFGLRIVDQIVAHEWRGILVIEAGVGDIAAVNELIRPLGYRAIFKRQRADLGPERIWLEVRWTRSNFGPAPADLIERVRQRFVVVSFEMEGAR
jgi:putative Mg2+ transporter-C (MgtC) family protein